MPQMSSKVVQAETAHTERRSATGPNGVALSPPAYGIDFVDRQVERENNTGLPDRLKAGIENLSGMAMDDVRVHYNSSKPRELQALAYTQGTNIYVGPGQERHLPHEAWHVVQQKEGRVRSTVQTKGVSINNDDNLESEADRMGVEAIQAKPNHLPINGITPLPSRVTQCLIRKNAGSDHKEWYEKMFQYRYFDDPKTHLSGTHNYAFEENNYNNNWARSKSNTHAEMKLLQYVSPSDDGKIGIVSELSPCKDCSNDLGKFEEKKEIEITFYHFLNYTDKSANINKDEVLNFYKERKYIEVPKEKVNRLTTEGERVLRLSEEKEEEEEEEESEEEESEGSEEESEEGSFNKRQRMSD